MGEGLPPCTVYRVNGRLGVARAIGDEDFKQPNLPPEQNAVTCVPDVTVHEIGPDVRLKLCYSCNTIRIGSLF